MKSQSSPTATPDFDEVWQRFKVSRSKVLGNWVEAERALALANREGSANGASGDRLLAAEAALQSAIVDFAASEKTSGDPMPLALGMLRLAESELFPVPPDLRQPDGGSDRRRSERRGSGGGDRRRVR